MKRRWTLRSWSIATCAGLLAGAGVAGASPAMADYRADCNPDGDSRQVVVLVHGIASSARTWDEANEILTGGGGDTCTVRFDYSAHNTNWVTDEHIGPALAQFILSWSDTSARGGGTGKVVVVAHSMGGLATRCALDPDCSGEPDVARTVAGVVTFGTPNTGSGLRGSDLTPAFNLLLNVLSATCRLRTPTTDSAQVRSMCQTIKDFSTSDATKAFTPDSPELRALPHIPDSVPVYAVAGKIDVTLSVLGHTTAHLDSVGDLVVGVRSALDEAQENNDLGGSETIDCGTVDFSVAAPSFSAQYCWHGSETSDEEFLTTARRQVQRAHERYAAHVVTLGPGPLINGEQMTANQALALLEPLIDIPELWGDNDDPQDPYLCGEPGYYVKWEDAGLQLTVLKTDDAGNPTEPYIAGWELYRPTADTGVVFQSADGVRVGDPESKINRLYPDVEADGHSEGSDNWTEYNIGGYGSYLNWAGVVVVDGVVVDVDAGFYCHYD